MRSSCEKSICKKVVYKECPLVSFLEPSISEFMKKIQELRKKYIQKVKEYIEKSLFRKDLWNP